MDASTCRVKAGNGKGPLFNKEYLRDLLNKPDNKALNDAMVDDCRQGSADSASKRLTNKWKEYYNQNANQDSWIPIMQAEHSY